MPEMVVPGPVTEERSIREAVCVHTRKIFDSCREEDIAPYRLSITRKINRAEGEYPSKTQWAWFSFPCGNG